MLIALYHAWRTGRKKSWNAAWICGTANDIFFMFMPFCDNFWQAQASVMITPRLPLYIVEMYACVMYYAPVAASLFSRSNGLNPVGQACCTGLLAHLYYGVYDINGPRNLWWTWHDGDPAIRERAVNAPYGSSLWILTYCSLQSFLNSWILRAPGARLTGCVAPTGYDMTATSALLKVQGMLGTGMARQLNRLLGTCGAIDRLHAFLGRSSDLVQILFRAATCTPLFMVAMGQLQVFSLDKIGIPGKPTYRLTVALMLGVIVKQFIDGRGRSPAKALPASFRTPNRIFLGAVFAHFALHTAINVWSLPERHASTGIHQRASDAPATVKDICGWDREEDLPATGPHIASEYDYTVTPQSGIGKPPDAIDMRTSGDDAHWYTVYGRLHRDRARELGWGVAMAAMGSAAFAAAMSTEL